MKQEKNAKQLHGRLLTVKLTQEFYGLPAGLLYWWIRNKKFDFFKIGKSVVFWEFDFLEFLRRHKISKSDASET